MGSVCAQRQCVFKYLKNRLKSKETTRENDTAELWDEGKIQKSKLLLMLSGVTTQLSGSALQQAKARPLSRIIMLNRRHSHYPAHESNHVEAEISQKSPANKVENDAACTQKHWQCCKNLTMRIRVFKPWSVVQQRRCCLWSGT